MNFSITRGKVIGSIVAPLILWALIFMFGKAYNSSPSFISRFLAIHDSVRIFSLGNISLFIIEVLAVYLIWSLFQK